MTREELNAERRKKTTMRCPKCGEDGTLVYAQAIYSKAPATVLHIDGGVRRTCLLRQTELAKIEEDGDAEE
ncbi:MAG: hypothetical protein J2P56_06975 [Verrucomicrobia bacterium]|nr:hypothetical protein [Verrucomicrobiota bacterium]